MRYKARRLICGVGINDADYVTQVMETIGYKKQRLSWICPFYAKWKGMITRCYSDKYKEKRPSYEGARVCDDWIYFSKFKAWMETQNWESAVLDKDLLLEGNKLYSPETCVFISAALNSFLTTRDAERGEFPLGVNFCKQNGKYRAECGGGKNGKRHVGYFDNPEDAHQAWKEEKANRAKILLETETNHKVIDAITKRFIFTQAA